MLNILILLSGNSETCKRNNFAFWVTEHFVTVSQFLDKFYKNSFTVSEFSDRFYENSTEFRNIMGNFRKFDTIFAILRYTAVQKSSGTCV